MSGQDNHCFKREENQDGGVTSNSSESYTVINEQLKSISTRDSIMESPRASQRAGQSPSSTLDSESPETRARGAKECFDLLTENLTDSSVDCSWGDMEGIPEDDFRNMKRIFGYLKMFEKCIEDKAKKDNWKDWRQQYWKFQIDIGKTEQCTPTAFILSLQILEQGLKSDAFTSFSITDSEDRKHWVDKCGTLLDPDEQKEFYEAMLKSVDKLLQVFGYSSFQDLSQAVKVISRKMEELAVKFDTDASLILFKTIGHIGLSIGIGLETFYINTNFLRYINGRINPGMSIFDFVEAFASNKMTPTKDSSYRAEINEVMEDLNKIEKVMNALILVLKNLLGHMCETCPEWDQILFDGLSIKDSLNQKLTYEREKSVVESLFPLIHKAINVMRPSPSVGRHLNLLYDILYIVVVVWESYYSWGDYKVASGKAEALREAKDTLEIVNKKIQDAFYFNTKESIKCFSLFNFLYAKGSIHLRRVNKHESYINRT